MSERTKPVPYIMMLELTQLRAELARVTEERDRYREALIAISREIRLAGDYDQQPDTSKIWRIAEAALTTPEPPASSSSEGREPR